MTKLSFPPFHAEHIGSLLRPNDLLVKRRDFDRGVVSEADLRFAEDEAIEQAIALQLKLGLSSITDGEFRRTAYSDSFTTDVFSGVIISSTSDRNWTYSDVKGQISAGRVPVVVDKLEWPGPVNLKNFKFVAARAGEGIPKVTLPGPCYIHFRAGRENISRHIYPKLDGFWQDLISAYVKEINSLYVAGCRYIQLDETSIAKLGDPKIREGIKQRGEDWQDLLEVYTDVINEILKHTPKDLAVGLHLCRGNKAGSWQAEGGYNDVAKKLFGKLHVQFYFLEFDSPRAGGFEPLREVPDNKMIILGLVSTKTNLLETAEELKSRIEKAEKFVEIKRLGISPQCGFASLDKGNAISFKNQSEKISCVVDVAREVWGYQPIVKP